MTDTGGTGGTVGCGSAPAPRPSPEQIAALAALLTLPKMGPARLRRLLDRHGSAATAWEATAAGRIDLTDVGGRIDDRPTLATSWQASASTTDPAEVVGSMAAAGIEILDPAHPSWPAAFVDDPEPPALLFSRGNLTALDGACVAIVGTRRCTAVGASLARELGHDLAAAGVAVVSGLALGVDGAAHRGSLDAGGRPIGVVATGHDVVYPRRHRTLWDEVSRKGVLLTEAPLGTKAERWRFPARNRLMAALADLVVVVESGAKGGSMLTVDAAIERDTEVMAVPGSPRVPASTGPNQLLADGCGVVRDATDVLVALGTRAPGPSGRARPGSEQLSLDDADPVLDAISFPPIGLDRLVAVTGLSFATLAGRVAQLEVDGLIERVGQGFQRRAR